MEIGIPEVAVMRDKRTRPRSPRQTGSDNTGSPNPSEHPYDIWTGAEVIGWACSRLTRGNQKPLISPAVYCIIFIEGFGYVPQFSILLVLGEVALRVRREN